MALVQEVLDSHLVDTTDVARVLQSTPRSVARWQQDRVSPRRDSEERLLELKAVLDLAATVMREPAARLWLRSPVADLEYEKPLDLIAKGEFRRVVASLLALADGVTA